MPGSDPDSMTLQRPRPPGEPDFLSVSVRPGSKLDPDTVRKEMESSWKSEKSEVVRGKAEWLPKAEWPTSLKVYRFDAALIHADAAGRRNYYYGYIVQTGHDRGLYVDVETSVPPGDGKASGPKADNLTKDAEALIKSFQFGAVQAGTN